VPKNFYQIASASTENIEVTCVRVAAEPLLDLQGQTDHPATHVTVASGDPNPNPRADRDHLDSALRAAATKTGEADTPICTRAPLASSTTMAAAALAPSSRSGVTTTSENLAPPISWRPKSSCRHR
jgi:hypothetical protein